MTLEIAIVLLIIGLAFVLFVTEALPIDVTALTVLGVLLLIGFILLRMLGQGSLSLTSNYFINQWWVRRRGTVLGISGILVAWSGGFILVWIDIHY